jgi:hypothetical protein
MRGGWPSGLRRTFRRCTLAGSPAGSGTGASDGEEGQPERLLAELLARFQEAGQLRPGFDPTVMAVTIRAAIDAVPPRLVSEPDLDIDNYAAQIATTFHLATRTEEPDR